MAARDNGAKRPELLCRLDAISYRLAKYLHGLWCHARDIDSPRPNDIDPAFILQPIRLHAI
jgi:hypothetical protein